MTRFPWSGWFGDGEDDRHEPIDTDGGDEGEDESTGSVVRDERKEGAEEDPIVTCTFQDGTLSVYDDVVHIDRPRRSDFSEKWIALNQIQGVTYADRFVIHYIQLHQRGFENDEASLLSTPVDENTLHFGGGKKDCARRARDAILERAPVE